VERITHHFFHVENIHIEINHCVGVIAAIADMQKTARGGFNEISHKCGQYLMTPDDLTVLRLFGRIYAREN
jgi:hypothetical protein